MNKLTGLIGYPLSHSLSPRIHAYWIAEHGLDVDYKLFTTPPAQRERVAQLGAELGLVLSRIGQIEAEPGLRLWRGASAVAAPAEGRQAVPNRWTSFDHFKGAA